MTLAIAAVLVFLVPLAAVHANHPQTAHGDVIVFDHKTGNEWWVEVVISGGASGSVTGVRAMDTGGLWVALTKRSWGAWAGSFHIENGHDVRFEAYWSGSEEEIQSCWFTHPAGVEQCSAPPPPPPPPPSGWQTTAVGEARHYGSGGDMALADIDNDGRRNVLVGGRNGMVAYEWSGAAWISEQLSLRVFDTSAAGDGDNDGQSEAYGMAVSSPGMDLVQYRNVGNGWEETLLVPFAEVMAGDMTFGNIDGAVGTELYVGMVVTVCDPDHDPTVPPNCTHTSPIYHVRDEGSFWSATPIATLNGRINSMWIGDGDNNGRFELYVGHGTRHADRTTQVQSVNGQWVTTGFSGSGSDSGYSLVVVGDGDRDGRNEVYQINWNGVVLKHSFDQVNGWTVEMPFGFNGMTTPEGVNVRPTGFFLGDADSDGSQELYIATDFGELYQARYTGNAWTATRISYPDDPFGRGKGANGLLVVGDGDGDGRREAYAAFAFHMPSTGEDGVDRTYKVAIPPAMFDATFTGVRGNEWWVQANVVASEGTLAKVDVSLNGGEWTSLDKQSWGGWAASYRILQGTAVQFRATSTAGATDLSDCYRWIPPPNTDASKVACTGTPPPPPPGFDASFTGVKGNEWWVQATVSGNEPIAKVEARVNCGSTWIALNKESYGWAKSFHVPNGSKVDFRATSASGATDLSGGYIWPNATPTGGC